MQNINILVLFSCAILLFFITHCERLTTHFVLFYISPCFILFRWSRQQQQSGVVFVGFADV